MARVRIEPRQGDLRSCLCFKDGLGHQSGLVTPSVPHVRSSAATYTTTVAYFLKEMTCCMPLGRFVNRMVISGSGAKWICSAVALARQAAGSAVPC
jgi:hypothetical protein